jgi:hypothetical protein
MHEDGTTGRSVQRIQHQRQPARSMRAGVVRLLNRSRPLDVTAAHQLARDRNCEQNSDYPENYYPLATRRILTRPFDTTTAERFIKCLLVRHDTDLLVSHHHSEKRINLLEII